MRPLAVEAASLCAASVEAMDGAARTATIRIGARLLTARLDAALDAAVVVTALERGERVIVQHEEGEWLVLGALRTAATPGVDVGEDFVIRAQRVKIQAEHELSMVTGLSRLAMTARGHIETLASVITSRASGVQKIVGRIIHLN
jgi:hypothetical protein